LTHRCHDRRFLLKFAKDRDTYRKWLREATARTGVPVYGYCITCNHVHIVAHANKASGVGAMMQLVAGAYGQQLNRRKGFEGSVWEHPYQCTIIQDGQHLINCLRYVSLNMVRAGIVEHPSEWRWSGHDELTGDRSRYTILALDSLIERLSLNGVSDLKRIYDDGIEVALNRRELKRSPEWTESLAVGDQVFVERVARDYERRSEFSYSQIDSNGGMSLKEESVAYNPLSGVKPAPKKDIGAL